MRFHTRMYTNIYIRIHTHTHILSLSLSLSRALSLSLFLSPAIRIVILAIRCHWIIHLGLESRCSERIKKSWREKLEGRQRAKGRVI